VQYQDISCILFFMLTKQRKSLLLERLAQDGRIVAKDLAHELGLSDDTIRRDLRELAADGLLQRVHGGALPAAPAEADLKTRKDIASASKQQVGRTAASLVKPDSVVILDGGTTTLQLVHHLPKDLPCTIVTHSPTIAVALADHTRIKVVMIGGVLFRHSMVNIGAATVEALQNIRADCYFMGVTGISVADGLSTGDLEEAHVKRALSASAAETVILGSAEKLNVASPYIVMALTNASGIVLDSAATPDSVAEFKGAGLDVYCG
jgi:DeoR/GlpR family transcriptional regulator of sugar metabolism